MADEPNTDPAQTEGDDPTTDAKTVPLSELRSERSKRQKLEKQVAELLEAQRKREEAELGELEKAQKRAQELEAELQAERTARVVEGRRSLVQAEAARLGFEDPADALAFLRDDLADTERAEEDLKAAVEKLAKDRPRLLKGEPQATAPGRMAPPAANTDPSMSPEERLKQRFAAWGGAR